MKSRKPVLIANRGEIAIRIARTAKRLGFPTVAVYSDADRFAEHIRYCDQAIGIGGEQPKDSYLVVDRILEAAKKTGAGFIHPGYGFLSERAYFVEACERAGIVFVGPSADSMNRMGDKITARATVDEVGMPRVPGSAGAVKDAGEAARVAAQIGYPVLLKATAGGGGKGMRRVDSEKDLTAAFEAATREAQGAFADGSLYVEKYILDPHHIEIQVFGDGRGGAIHIGERECSIQRRHQKVWEESPSPLMEKYPEAREKMAAAAVRVAQHVKYAGAGTFEFVADGKGNFYFLEMNTRLQVEHPVSEWVSGVDLVAWQLLLAAGEFKLPETPARRGSAIEVRIYAEDPHHFLPGPGPLGEIHLPSGPFVRVDSAFHGAGEVTLHYDPMIAKVSTWGLTREEAIGRLRVALEETRVVPPLKPNGNRLGSLKTNLSFLKRLCVNAQVLSGDTTTDLISKNPSLTEAIPQEPSLESAIATSLFQTLEEQSATDETGGSDAACSSVWNLAARREGVRL